MTGLKRAFQNKLHSLRGSSPGRSGGGAGKGRRACTASLEFEYLHRKDDAKCWLAEMTLPLARVFQCLFTFALVSALADWRKSACSVDREPQGNWRWNSNSRDVVASSPSFSRLTARAPRPASSQATPSYMKVLIKIHVEFTRFFKLQNVAKIEFISIQARRGGGGAYNGM